MKKKFIESISLLNGIYQNLEGHQARLNQTFDHYFPDHDPHMLNSILPSLELDGQYKVRVVYDASTTDIEYAQYLKRKIETIKIVDTPPFDYAFKFEDRTKINALLATSRADEIIIGIDGHLTDSSYANLAFWNGSDWLTPSTPLLKGTKRQLLLSQKIIKEAPIRVSDLDQFTKVSLVNAMLDLDDIAFPISSIRH